ncbi:MAG: hypothetical protein ACKVU4_05140 [Phycisphaerales bacterium]
MKPALYAITVLLVSPAVRAQGPYAITQAVVGAGGATLASGGAYALGGTLGQPVAGSGAGGSYGIAVGFWGGGAPACYPDCNASGSLTVADFGCFQTRYVLGDAYADCNASGALSVADFGCFQTAYALGCP